MRIALLIFFPVFLVSCDKLTNPSTHLQADQLSRQAIVSSKVFEKRSWQYFLQHLPLTTGPVRTYTGKPIASQQKHVALVNYDVGTGDLQQCADALIRLRAEYLFGQQRHSEIGFHFVSGQFYSWNDYCGGRRPVVSGNRVRFVRTTPCSRSHQTLRRYLDIIYSYSSTISLAQELKKTNDFAVGTVIIRAGSPGHCFIIIDEALNAAGQKVYKLAEGYTPAQSIYILRNVWQPGLDPWYPLGPGTIRTSSYVFTNYKLGSFE